MINSWKERYSQKIKSPIDALKYVKSGDRIFIGSGCAEPTLLLKSFSEVLKKLSEIEVFHTISPQKTLYIDEKYSEKFRHNVFFVTPNFRKIVIQGKADYTPVFPSEIPNLFKYGRIKLDVALIQLTPPDEHGFMSFGVSVDVVKSAAENAKLLIAEINPQMPRTMGDSFIHADRVDIMVENDAPLEELIFPDPDDVAIRIARNLAKLIEHGATLHMGIGTVINALPQFLKNKKDLGIHSEMISDPIIELVKQKIVTNQMKSIHRGKIVASLAIGTKKLYEFLDNNPMVEMHPTEYVNDINIIGNNEKMVSINPGIEIDLTGQAYTDSLRHYLFSGIGSQLDFMRGTARSKGGKVILILPSLTLDGKRSRIVPKLEGRYGAFVSRRDLHYVVTEYGIAYLHGKNIRERAMELIHIAHPDHRKELLSFAKKVNLVFLDQILPPRGGMIYPEKYETTHTFKDNKKIFFRPVKPTDERMFQDLLYSLPDEEIYFRFFGPQKSLSHKKIQHLVNIDYDKDMVIVGIVFDEKENETMVAEARFESIPNSDIADFAIAVHYEWQNIGIGYFLLRYLIKIAKQRGIKGFRLDVMGNNKKMRKLVQKCRLPVKYQKSNGDYEIYIFFEEKRKNKFDKKNKN